MVTKLYRVVSQAEYDDLMLTNQFSIGPNSIADNLMRWEKLDNIGPARYAELDQLEDVIIRGVE